METPEDFLGYVKSIDPNASALDAAKPQFGGSPVDRGGHPMPSDENFAVIESDWHPGIFHPLKRKWADGTFKTDEELESDFKKAENQLMIDRKMYEDSQHRIVPQGYKVNAEGTEYEELPQHKPGREYSKKESFGMGVADGLTDTLSLAGRGMARGMKAIGVLDKSEAKNAEDALSGGMASGVVETTNPQGFNRDEMIAANPKTYMAGNLAGGLVEGAATFPLAAAAVGKAGQVVSKAATLGEKANMLKTAAAAAGKTMQNAGKGVMVENFVNARRAAKGGTIGKTFGEKLLNSAYKRAIAGGENVIQGAPITAARTALELTGGNDHAIEDLGLQTGIDLGAPFGIHALGKVAKGAYKGGKGAYNAVTKSKKPVDGPFRLGE